MWAPTGSTPPPPTHGKYTVCVCVCVCVSVCVIVSVCVVSLGGQRAPKKTIGCAGKNPKDTDPHFRKHFFLTGARSKVQKEGLRRGRISGNGTHAFTVWQHSSFRLGAQPEVQRYNAVLKEAEKEGFGIGRGWYVDKYGSKVGALTCTHTRTHSHSHSHPQPHLHSS